MSLRPSTARRRLDAMARAQDAVRRANIATCWHERAETMARAEEHSYALAGARADQLRRYGYIPVEEVPA